MIVALLNRKGGVGKATLALHLAGQWGSNGKRVVVIDADPQGSALDWSQQRAKELLPRLFGVLALPRDTLHREASDIARNADHVVIDGPPHLAPLMRYALLAAELIVIPALPSPFDGRASEEILLLIREARVFRFTAQLTIDVAPDLRGRIKLVAFQCRTTVADMVADLLSRQFPGNDGGAA